MSTILLLQAMVTQIKSSPVRTSSSTKIPQTSRKDAKSQSRTCSKENLRSNFLGLSRQAMALARFSKREIGLFERENAKQCQRQLHHHHCGQLLVQRIL